MNVSKCYERAFNRVSIGEKKGYARNKQGSYSNWSLCRFTLDVNAVHVHFNILFDLFPSFLTTNKYSGKAARTEASNRIIRCDSFFFSPCSPVCSLILLFLHLRSFCHNTGTQRFLCSLQLDSISSSRISSRRYLYAFFSLSCHRSRQLAIDFTRFMSLFSAFFFCVIFQNTFLSRSICFHQYTNSFISSPFVLSDWTAFDRIFFRFLYFWLQIPSKGLELFFLPFLSLCSRCFLAGVARFANKDTVIFVVPLFSLTIFQWKIVLCIYSFKHKATHGSHISIRLCVSVYVRAFKSYACKLWMQLTVAPATFSQYITSNEKFNAWIKDC